jgi:hypothetical protein
MNDSLLHRCDTRLGSPRFGALALGSLCLMLAACGSERLSLGAGEAPLEPAEVACGGGVVHGSVDVNNQPELEALAGCEEIVGNLHIEAFEGVDLRPLSALRIVRGDLHLLSETGLEHFESLEGLEALEQVSRLMVRNLRGTDLSPLAHLKRVELDPLSPWPEGGSIEIAGCPNLTDLSGLGGLEQWDTLFLESDDSLASLNGLGLPLLGRPSIRARLLPALRDLSALEGLESMTLLTLAETGLEHIAPLGMKSITSFGLEGNAALVDIDGLAALEILGGFTLRQNHALEHLPEWPLLSRLSNVQIVDNAELRSIPAYVTQALNGPVLLGNHLGPVINPDILVRLEFMLFEVGRNPKLTELTLPAGLVSGQYIGIYDNGSLASLDLNAISQLDQLSIRNNAVLENVAIPGLGAVDHLVVEGNPMLPSDAFAGVASFTRVIEGNAGDPP